MSDINEYSMSDEDAYQYHLDCVADKIWVTQHGDEIAIQDMAIEHIERCIAMLNKDIDAVACGAMYLPLLEQEQLKRIKDDFDAV